MRLQGVFLRLLLSPPRPPGACLPPGLQTAVRAAERRLPQRLRGKVPLPPSAPRELRGALPRLRIATLQLSFLLLMRWFKSGESRLCARQLKLKVIKAKSFPATESTEHVEIA